jgi:FkbM family methyltransferase
MGRVLYQSGCYEPNEMFFTGTYLGPGMVFVDVGANFGCFTLLAASRVGPSGTVLAVEPSSREVDELRSNLALNGIENVAIAPVAVGEVAGVATLLVAEEEHSGHNTLGSFVYDTKLLSYEAVKVTTLDDLVDANRLERVDLVKIDVEGAELRVLEGAGAVLRERRPVILMELQRSSLQAQGASPDDILRLLDVAGYLVFGFDPASGYPSASADVTSSANIVSVPTEKLAGLIDLGIIVPRSPDWESSGAGEMPNL